MTRGFVQNADVDNSFFAESKLTRVPILQFRGWIRKGKVGVTLNAERREGAVGSDVPLVGPTRGGGG